MNYFKVLLLLLSFGATAFAADTTATKDLGGTWRYYKKVFKGTEMPEPPEATLRMFFSFFADGSDRLIWTHDGQWDWCERKGIYTVESDFLHDEISWVNPANSRGCASDPDMQLGRKEITPITIAKNGDLEIHLFIGDDPLIMVWKKLGE